MRQSREIGTITSPVATRKISREEDTHINDEQYEFGETQKRQILADILSKDSGDKNYKPLIINKGYNDNTISY